MSTQALQRDVMTLDEPSAAPVVAQSETAAIVSMIERAARDPSVDIDKMERLMALQERMRLQDAERRFNEAMGLAQAEMPRVLRDAVNDHSKSRYARLETISKAITPVITKHGFSLSFDTERSDLSGHHRVVCTVAHSGGFSRRHQADLPSDTAGAQGKANKTAIQGFGSTVSYGRRYLTLLIFNVALTNEDDDGCADERAAEVITDDQAMELREMVEASNANLGKFLGILRAESIPDILAKDFNRAVGILQDRLNQRGRS